MVGKEKSKHKRKQQLKELHTNTFDPSSAKAHVNERDRRDYFTPSSALFDDFTRQLEQKYRVQSAVTVTRAPGRASHRPSTMALMRWFRRMD